MQACRTAVLAVLLAAAAGCGGPAAQQPPPDVPDEADDGPGGGPSGDGAAGGLDAGAVCDRILALRDAGCGFVAGYDLDRAACVDDVERSASDPLAVAAGRCFVEQGSCDAVTACVDRAITSAATPADTATPADPDALCPRADELGPVLLPAAEYARRHGAGARRYGDVVSTREQPIEVCGVEGELAWLVAARCADDSAPFADAGAAHAARVGSAGPGGACGSIVDLYEVTCPEQTYEIYMDMYVCLRQ